MCLYFLCVYVQQEFGLIDVFSYIDAKIGALIIMNKNVINYQKSWEKTTKITLKVIPIELKLSVYKLVCMTF